MQHSLFALAAILLGVIFALGAYLLLRDTAQGHVGVPGRFTLARDRHPFFFWTFVSIGALLGNAGVGMTIVGFLVLVGMLRT